MPSCPEVSADLSFLGSNRLPHCSNDPSDPQCDSEYFYAGETIRWQAILKDNNISLTITGNPVLLFKIILGSPGDNGYSVINRYASLDLSNSNLIATNTSNAVLEFVYTLQGTDQGGIPVLDNSNSNNINASFITNDDNKIVYSKGSLCSGMIDFSTNITILSNMDNVFINGDNSLNNNNNVRLLIKRSDTPNKVPLTTDLLDGELALNTNDGIVYFKRDNGTIESISSDSSNTETVNLLALGSVSGVTSIDFGTDRSVQTATLNGTSTTFTKGINWPSSSTIVADVILRITVSSATSITWSIVTDWFNQPVSGALSTGTHLFLLRAIGSSIVEGHYIGNKTN
jgi:hypothetical protein